MNAAQAQTILDAVKGWADHDSRIQALAVCGSWARGNAHAGSDLDLMLLADDPGLFRQDDWLPQIAWREVGLRIMRSHDADWGPCWSRTVWCAPDAEVEFTFGPPSWAAIDPVDAGTAGVIARNGCRIMLDRAGLLARLLAA